MSTNWNRLLALLAALAAIAVIGAGCGGDDDEGSSETAAAEQAPSTDTAAASLRADLTHLLTEHVELAGVALVNGVQEGLESPQFDAAAKTLDQNSIELSEAIGTIYGAEAGDQFLDLWRSHIGFIVDYAEGKATGNDQQVEKALADLDGYREDFGAFLESANPNLTKAAVADALVPHIQSVAKTVDDLTAGTGNPYVDLQEAADHMPEIANVFAGAIVEQNPDQFDGSADDGAAELRANLTHLLDQHTYSAAIAIVTAISAGPDSPEYAAAGEALNANTEKIAGAITDLYGKPAGDQFSDLWNAHIGFFVDYTLAGAAGDKQGQKKARADLDGYREDFGAFLESANPNLTKEAVAEALVPHVDSAFLVIDDALAADTAVFEDLRTAASHMPDLANTLAGAFVAQFPEKFPNAGTSADAEASEETTTEEEPTASGDSAVTIKTFIYDPDPIEVDAGTTVTWTNDDDILHTVTSGTREQPSKGFGEQLDGAGSTAEVTFGEPGTYDYFCSIHDGMDGQVVVN